MNSQTAKPAARALRPRERYSFTDFLFVVPALALLALLTYYPLWRLVQISFTDWNLINLNYKNVGLKNWTWLFTSNVSQRYLFNTLAVTMTYTVGHIAVVLVFGVLLAALFNKLTPAFSVMRAVVFMPRYIAMSTAAVIFLWMMNFDCGILNHFLKTIGISSVPWLENRSVAMVSVLILTSWHGLGYSMMIYLSAMRGISRDYYEAASLDGASGAQSFRYITLPLLSPTTLFLFVTTFIGSMKVYQSVDVLTSGGPYQSTEVFVYYIYRLAFQDFRIDRASVNALLLFVILLAVTASTLKITNKNVHYDA